MRQAHQKAIRTDGRQTAGRRQADGKQSAFNSSPEGHASECHQKAARRQMSAVHLRERDELGRKVVGRAADIGEQTLLAGAVGAAQRLRQTEVGNLDRECAISHLLSLHYEDVRRLQVAVHHAVLVQVADGADDLARKARGSELREGAHLHALRTACAQQ